jgi:hypothetical protein
MNVAVELDDSELESIRRDDGVTVLRLVLYVHSSTGCPGSDAGSGWTEDGEMRIGSASVSRVPPVLPLRVLTGLIQVAGESAVSVDLSGVEGSFVSTGDSIRLVRTGPARDVESFPGRR